MDTLFCSTHSGNEAIKHCIFDNALICVKCFGAHSMHEIISVEEFQAAQRTYCQIALIQERSTLMAKHKDVAGNLFNLAEIQLDKQKKSLMNSSPGIIKQNVFKNFHENG